MTVFKPLLVLSFFSALNAAPALGATLRHAERLDFRIEVGREPYLLRIARRDLTRLAEAISLGEPVPSVASALSVREDLYPPKVSSQIPPELARRAVSLWRLVEERGWTDAAGVEWDPALGKPGRVTNDRGDILRDAPGPAPGTRAGIWSTPERGSLRDSKTFGVRCIEALSGPKRCFRVWSVEKRRRAP